MLDPPECIAKVHAGINRRAGREAYHVLERSRRVLSFEGQLTDQLARASQNIVSGGAPLK